MTNDFTSGQLSGKCEGFNLAIDLVESHRAAVADWAWWARLLIWLVELATGYDAKLSAILAGRRRELDGHLLDHECLQFALLAPGGPVSPRGDQAPRV